MTQSELVLSFVRSKPNASSRDILSACASRKPTGLASCSNVLSKLFRDGVLTRKRNGMGYIYNLPKKPGSAKVVPQNTPNGSSVDTHSVPETTTQRKPDGVYSFENSFSAWWSDRGAVLTSMFAVDECDKKLPKDEATKEALRLVADLKTLVCYSFSAGFFCGSKQIHTTDGVKS